jgi:hypothetical protein
VVWKNIRRYKMTDIEMAEDYYYRTFPVTLNIGEEIRKEWAVRDFLAGLKAGRPKWHYVKDELPEISGRYFVYTGGESFILYFDTEAGSFGYWVTLLGDNLGVQDEVFETVEDREEDEVIAWCEIPIYTEEASE